MKRHRTDIAALLFGLAFVIYAGTFVASELSDTDIEPAWISAIAFVTLGVVALAATLLRGTAAPAELTDRPTVPPLIDSGDGVDDVGEG